MTWGIDVDELAELRERATVVKANSKSKRGAQHGPVRNKKDQVPCACGCETLIWKYDKKGHERKYAKGHYWPHRKDGKKKGAVGQ